MNPTVNVNLLIRAKNAHESRYHRLLIALSDDDIEWKFFKSALNFLCQAELNEIVTERVCKDKCGYVLCNRLIKIHPTAVVTLSLSKRQIYNISNRKQYCSDWCYAAHKHIESQLPEDPIWKNTDHVHRTYKLYSKSAEGCAGELVFEDSLKLASTVKQVPLKASSTTSKNINTAKKIVTVKPKPITKEVKDLNDVIQKVKLNQSANPIRKTILLNECVNNPNLIKNPPEVETLKHAKKAVEIICQWITEHCRDYLFSSENSKFDLDNSEYEYHQDKDENTNDPEMYYPLMDNTNDDLVQKSLLIKQLQKYSLTPLIMEDFGLNKNDFSTVFKRFLDNCSVSASHVNLKMEEFKWIIIFLVDVMSEKFVRKNQINKIQMIQKYGISNPELYENLLAYIKKSLNGV